MKFLFDYFPLILFFGAFKLYDIYVATGAAMAASLTQVGFFWVKNRRFENLHLITLAAIMIFGGLTLILRDATFIKWKPTIVYWIMASLFIGSQFIGKKTVIERMLGKQIEMPTHIWSRQNLSWAVFFLFLGALNIYVAFYYAPEADPKVREETWVNFKVFGTLILTVVFILVQALMMAKHIKQVENKEQA